DLLLEIRRPCTADATTPMLDSHERNVRLFAPLCCRVAERRDRAVGVTAREIVDRSLRDVQPTQVPPVRDALQLLVEPSFVSRNDVTRMGCFVRRRLVLSLRRFDRMRTRRC